MNREQALKDVFKAHKVDAEIIDIVRGPSITQYQVRPGYGVRIKKFTSITNDIAMALAATDIRIEAPIPGMSALGIEVPNETRDPVLMQELLGDVDSHPMVIPLGKDTYGNVISGDLRKMPHLLVAGSTGSGKSVCINGIICSILAKASSDVVKFVMVDPKRVELGPYSTIPHLMEPIVHEADAATKLLAKIVTIMLGRYKTMAAAKVRNIEAYNLLEDTEIMPYIVVIIDELADLMITANKKVLESHIARLTQLARAAGIHLIIATQRPSVDVITGVIKSNIPSRIAFAVASGVDSKVILDCQGAEKLLGAGDMLYLPVGEPKPQRMQGAFLSDDEVNKYIEFSQQGLPLH